ncbi:MAG: hypothetical protein II956_11020 [Bacteroidales bacterium]|nr:hypothetical protein [Bacteroidales bacterium]
MKIKKNNITKVAITAALVFFTAISTVSAQTQSTITVSGTDYTLFTGFTATAGNGSEYNSYTNLVDGNTSTTWGAQKNIGQTGHFAGGESDPAFVEFHADVAFIPKGYILTNNTVNNNCTPTSWALKAKLTENDNWTVIHSSNTALGNSASFELTCSNDGNNLYQYFRFEIYDVGTTYWSKLNELQFYGSLPAYTHLTVKAATCTSTGIKRDCYRRNSDGKYFTDETGATELTESDVIAPIIAHTGVHHEATDVNIEYWQCSMCGKYFSDEVCTTEITEKDTQIYRTITIDNSISGLVKCYSSPALAGKTVLLFVSDNRIDALTLKVNDGAVELTPDGGDWYKFTMPAVDVTVTAEIAQSNVDGDILTGSIRHTVTIVDGASITLNNATITGSIVCEGSATITLVGTNSVSGATATDKAGIQIGSSGTTLTIRGEGSLTVNGGDQSAGIGLSRAWNPDNDVIGGDIVIESGTITATGGKWGSGIGTGVIYGNGSAKTARIGNVTIKGGTVKATGGSEADGIGTGYTYSGCTNAIGTVTIYDDINLVDASSIKDFANVVYMHGETDVTDNKSDYFAIDEAGDHRVINLKVTTIGALTIKGKTAEINGAYTKDETPVTLANDIEVNSITIDRTFQIGVTSTIILPFGVESGKYSGGTFYEFTSVDYKDGKWVASMTKVTGKIEAHKPYLFVPSSDKLTITGGVKLEATTAEEYSDVKGDWTFKGVFKVKKWKTSVRRDYFFASTSGTSTAGDAISAGDFVRVGNNCGLNPLRCYLSYSGSDAALSKADKQLPSSIEVRLIDEVASVVEPNDNPSDNDGDIETPVSEIIPNSGVKVWSFDKTIFIESQSGTDYTLVDLSGRTLKKGVTNSTREEVTLGSRTAGIVIVKVGKQTFKINY